MKKVTAACLIVFAAYSFPASAASEDDCDKSWNAYDVNRDGVLRGGEAQRFSDDMRAEGRDPWFDAKRRNQRAGLQERVRQGLLGKAGRGRAVISSAKAGP
jgi:hypothetical protein